MGGSEGQPSPQDRANGMIADSFVAMLVIRVHQGGPMDPVVAIKGFIGELEGKKGLESIQGMVGEVLPAYHDARQYDEQAFVPPDPGVVRERVVAGLRAFADAPSDVQIDLVRAYRRRIFQDPDRIK